MNTILKNCPKCNKEHNKPGIFCSRSCGNSRGPRTDEFKNTVREKLSGRIGHALGKLVVPRIERACSDCGKLFTIKITNNKKYCSNSCRNKNAGGYREGSGRSKSGYYNGIYCGSTYELCWVIHSLDHGIKFKRFDSLIEKDGLKYYPDFILDDNKTIIELKGFEKQESVDKKTALAESFGYAVNVLRKEDLQYAFDYVKEKYSTTKYHILYDEYKPKYDYVCNYCSKEFSRDKKLKTDVVFCSRQCCGKGHKGRS